MKFRTEGKPAPGNLVLIHGFLNTCSEELDIEDLGDSAAADTWLRSAALWTAKKPVSNAATETIRGFRETLRAFVLDKSSADNATRLNAYASKVSLGFSIGPERELDLLVRSSGINEVIGKLLSALQAAQFVGTWDRMKCCELETCGWAYYDTTRNRSGRWCSMKTCGSRHKARAYLQRKANA